MADEAFVREEEPVEEKPRRRSKNLRLKLTPDGGIDYDAMAPDDIENLQAVLAGDETIRATVQQMAQAANPAQLIQPQHVRFLLDAFAFAERMALPPAITAWAKKKGVDLVVRPEIAAEYLKFTEEQKDELAPCGALALERILPERIKQMIANAGPGAEFLSKLLMIEYLKLQQLVAACQADQQQRKPIKPNGHAEAPQESIKIEPPPSMEPL